MISLGAFAMIFGISYLKAKENLAMIEKNMNPREHANRPAPYRSLKTGLLFLGAGLGLLIAYIIDHSISRRHDSEPIYFALIAIGGGIGLIASYAVEKKEWLNQKNIDV
jgi:peptidoglycan/LPS O-acetylase OafA/YrhL